MKITLYAMLAALAPALAAQWAYAAVVGYLKVTVPPRADARLSVPLHQTETGTFSVASVANGAIAVNGDPFETDEFADLYYVRFITGQGRGLWSTIAFNDSSHLVPADPAVLAYVNAGDTFRIYKHHTLGSLFPAGLKGTAFNADTSILLCDNNRAQMQQNPSAARVAYWNDDAPDEGGQMWEGYGVDNNTIIPPETAFIVRNESDDELTILLPGNVPDFAVSVLTAPGGDLNIGSGYPVGLKLKDAGLGGEGRAVLFYENGTTDINKSASRTAYFDEEEETLWGGYLIDGNYIVQPAETITLRLPADDGGTKVTIPMPYSLP